MLLWTADKASPRLGRERDQRAELGNKVSASVKCAKVLRPNARVGGPEQEGWVEFPNMDCAGVEGWEGFGMNWTGPIEAAGTISIA